MRHQRSTRPWLPPAVLAIILLGIVLRAHGLERLGLVGDELEDLSIASGIIHQPNPFAAGAGMESAAMDQGRLPHYSAAAAWRLSRGNGMDAARALSIVWAALTLAALFALGRELFGPAAGLLALGFLAISLYDAGFSRFGMTTGSGLFTALLLASLLAWWRADRTGRAAWYWVAGQAIGLSIAAKLFGVFTLWLIGAWLWCWPPEILSRSWSPRPRTPAVRTLLAWTLAGLGVFAGLAVARLDPRLELMCFTATALAVLAAHAAVVARGTATVRGETRGAAGFLIGSLAVLWFFIGSPVHLDLGRLLAVPRVLPEWHNAAYGDSSLWTFAGILLVRLNAPFNALWIGAFIFCIARRREARYRLLLLAFGIPFTMLSLARFKVTWYLAMVFPVCYLMIAAALLEGWRRLRLGPRVLQGLAAGALLVGAGWYARQWVTLYPYYEMDGYRLGLSAIGWNRPSFVTFEALPDVAAWIDTHAPDGGEVACLLVGLPKYNRYATDHLTIYRRNPGVRYRPAGSVNDLGAARFVLTTLYTQALEPSLEAAGYERRETFRLKELPVGAVYARRSVP